jgi:cell division transport system permease protein
MSKAQNVFSAIRRTPYQSLSAIILTTLTFFCLSIFSLVLLGATQMLEFFESRPQVTAFFRDEATVADADNLKSEVSRVVAIEAAIFVSKEDALRMYAEQNQDNPLLLEMVTADILPASLEVSAKNVADLELIATTMQNNPLVEEVVFQKDVIDTLRKWLGGIRLAGLFLTALLTIASVTTIIVIIGLKFRSKKPEMYTLTLLGASNWYIRRPFVLESMLYAIAGAVIGWGASYILLLYLTPNLISFLGEIRLLPVPYFVMLALLAGEIIVGAILGGLSSLIATRRVGR